MLNVCLIGAGGVGTIAAYVLEKSQRCRVTAVLRSNYAVVKEQGFDIDSVDHGEVRGWKPHRGKPSADNTEGGLAFYHSKVSLRVPFARPFTLLCLATGITRSLLFLAHHHPIRLFWLLLSYAYSCFPLKSSPPSTTPQRTKNNHTTSS